MRVHGETMFNRHYLFFVLLIAAVAGPATYFNSSPLAKWVWPEQPESNASQLPAQLASFSLSPDRLDTPISLPVAQRTVTNEFNPSMSQGMVSPPAAPLPQSLILPGDENGPQANAIPLEIMPIQDMGEIFRFDISPNWVKQRWDRTSITAGDIGLSGMRISLVTGVNATDLFGALTYYFDARQTVQKITFQGWSGDPTNLINFMRSAYRFRRQPSSSAGLYLAQDRNRSTGVIYMQHPRVIRSNNPTQQVAIMLEVNNPNGPYQISQEVAATVFNTHR